MLPSTRLKVYANIYQSRLVKSAWVYFELRLKHLIRHALYLGYRNRVAIDDLYASIYSNVMTEFVSLLADRDYNICSLQSRILSLFPDVSIRIFSSSTQSTGLRFIE